MEILDLELKVFGLQIWVMLHFTRFGLEILWTAILNYILDTLPVLDLKIHTQQL